MGICSFAKCARYKRDGAAFPLGNAKLLAAWVSRTGRAAKTFRPTEDSYVCGNHFLESDWETKEGKKTLKEKVIPQPITFKKEDDLPTRKRKPSSIFPLTAVSFSKRSKIESSAEQDGPDNATLIKENILLKSKVEKLTKMLDKVFNKDQIAVLEDMVELGTEKWRPRTWSTETVLESIKLRFTCGTSGYNYLSSKLPYPNIRTLQRQSEAFKCAEGVQREILEIMPAKVKALAEDDRHVALVNDEVKITPGLHHDPSTDSTVGNATLPGQNGQATKGMVWIVAGMKLRIKEIVAYHFTTDSIDGKNIWIETKKVIQAVEKTGLKVDIYITDMASANISVWTHLGIKADRHGNVTCKIPHPHCSSENSEQRFLYIFADVIHLYKNLKAGLENNKSFTLSKALVEKYQLPSDRVEYSHFEMLMQTDHEDCLKLAPKLAKTTLKPNTFQQMSVHTTKKVLNYEAATALDFLADELQRPQLKTTAWFTIMVYNWFQLMSSTSVLRALSHRNEEKYQQAIQQLQEFMFIIRNVFVGKRTIAWKPWQTGILVTTTAVLELQEFYLDKCHFKFFLTSHLNSNCIENVFALLRLKHKVMNALQFKQDLKQLQLSKFFKAVTTSSYDPEDFVGLADAFKDFCKNNRRESKVLTPSHQSLNCPIQWNQVDLKNLSSSRLNVLFYIAGYILQSVQKNFKTCDGCFANIIVPKYVASYTELVRKRELKEGCLFYCSKECFEFFERMEKLFRAAINLIVAINREKLVQIFTADEKLLSFDFPSCHNIKVKIIKRFSLFRLRIELDNINRMNKKYESPAATGSKSMAQNYYTQNPMVGRKKKN